MLSSTCMHSVWRSLQLFISEKKKVGGSATHPSELLLASYSFVESILKNLPQFYRELLKVELLLVVTHIIHFHELKHESNSYTRYTVRPCQASEPKKLPSAAVGPQG